MSILGNLIWILFGGFFIAVQYAIAGLVYCVTVIGIPWGLQCFKMAALALLPFGSEVDRKPQSAGCLNTVMNIIWIFIGGIWICLSHILWGLILSITVIGIPFGLQHFKMAKLCLTPFGRSVRY